ncbi:SEFIR domain-containing protein [Marisediminitalea sp.]|uniref:SEFIR domain-containing protein n=1 Tax=Marisediminitalea sp. TaxID=2662268 RepID=UPI0035133FB5
MKEPKLFISYSWSSPSHEQWVLDLATELRESGIDVILDKWDLKEGHDSVAFMEKMVTDPEISKVIIVADKLYAAKADGRNGGVGTETQIISKEVYDNQEQDKFVAVVAEKDDAGKPCLPTYYKSRIYIDLSESERYAENFETLLRWIYNKPLYVKPEIGRRPAFLDESENVSLGTSASHKRVISALKENKTFSSGALDEYLELFSSNLERFRLSEIEGEMDDAVIENIEQFIPYRNEAIQLFITIAQYAPSDENLSKLHRFFETLIPYMNRSEHITSYRKWDFDNYKFIVHELFLYAIAILVKSEKFEQANVLLGQQYYLSGNAEYGRNVMVRFTAFHEYMECLERRNQRLALRRLSLRADLLEQRSKTSGIDFRYLMQADFILFMRTEIDKESTYDRWWPETLLYARRHHGAFEVFARATSRAYFDKVKCLLNIQDTTDLKELLTLYRDNRQELPRWQFDSFSPSALLGFEQLATKV